MAPAELAQLRIESQVFLRNWKRTGRKTTKYLCPCCKREIETIVAATNTGRGYGDSATTCTECGNLAMLMVWFDGRTQVLELPA